MVDKRHRYQRDQYRRILERLFKIIEEDGNLQEVRRGNCPDLFMSDPGRILDLKDRFERVKKGGRV